MVGFPSSADPIPLYFCHSAGPTPTMLGQSRLPGPGLVTNPKSLQKVRQYFCQF